MSSTESRVRFNILDVIIIIVLVALITGLFFRNNIISMLSKNDMVDITYTFEIKEIDRTRLSYLAQNVLLSEKESGKEMGKISTVSSGAAYTTDNKTKYIYYTACLKTDSGAT